MFTVSPGLWVDDCKWSAEKCVRVQLCFLASILMSGTPSFLITPRLPQKVYQLSTKPTSLTGHTLDSQQLNDNMWLNMSSLVILGSGPEKTTVSDSVLAKVHTHSRLILVTSDWCSWKRWILILLYLHLLVTSSYKFDPTSPTLAPVAFDHGCWCEKCHISLYRAANYQSWFLSGCVTD